jgi:hypothetical protein
MVHIYKESMRDPASRFPCPGKTILIGRLPSEDRHFYWCYS